MLYLVIHSTRIDYLPAGLPAKCDKYVLWRNNISNCLEAITEMGRIEAWRSPFLRAIYRRIYREVKGNGNARLSLGVCKICKSNCNLIIDLHWTEVGLVRVKQ